jgi:hypothetical protein
LVAFVWQVLSGGAFLACCWLSFSLGFCFSSAMLGHCLLDMLLCCCLEALLFDVLCSSVFFV